MSWITRCPTCGATYKVVPDQLKIAQGWLRCGQCREAFDSTGLVLDWPNAHAGAPADALSEPFGQRVPIDPLLKREDRSSLVAAVRTVSDVEQTLAAFQPQPPKLPVPAAGSDAVDEPEPAHSRPPRAWLNPAIWIFLCGGLALQWLWVGRHALANADPAIGQRLVALCRVGGCDILPLPMRDGVLIDSSSLTPHGEGLLLNWSVRNATAHALQMPALELTLLDAQDKALVRRVLSASAQGAPSSLASGQVWEGRLHLTPEAGVSPAGYRLLSFYP